MGFLGALKTSFRTGNLRNKTGKGIAGSFKNKTYPNFAKMGAELCSGQETAQISLKRRVYSTTSNKKFSLFFSLLYSIYFLAVLNN